MSRVVRGPIGTEALAYAFVGVLLGCDAVVSLDPVIGDTDAVIAPDVLGDWTHNDTVVYRVTADVSDPAAYVVRLTGPSIADDPDLGDVVLTLRATRLQKRLLVEIAASETDSVLGRVTRGYGNLLQPAYVHAALLVNNDSLRAFPLGVSAVREAMASGTCPLANGRALLRASGVVLGGAASELRAVMSCLLDQPGVLTESEVLHRPRPRARPREPGRDSSDVESDRGSARRRPGPG